MDVRKTIAELTSQLSEVNYESDEDNLLLKGHKNHDKALDCSTREDNDFVIESSKLRKSTASVDFPAHTYSGKITTRKKTFSITDEDNGPENTNITDDSSSQYGSIASDPETDENNDEVDSDEAYSSEEDSSKEDLVNTVGDKTLPPLAIYSAKSKTIPSDVKKGTAIRNQIKIWESLLECRIKLQKGLVACNNFPAKENLIKTKVLLDSESQAKINKVKKNLLITLGKMVTLQKELLKQNTELSSGKEQNVCDMDIEIKSDESEIEDDLEEEVNDDEEPQQKKKKLNDYAALIGENHNKFIKFRNASIEKWNDKTKVSTGKMANNNFSAFDQSTLKQIEQIMADKSRLIRRTRLRRDENHSSNNSDKDVLLKSSQEEHLDPEIFDDTDFYHKLLRDYIERKSVDVTNSTNTERQMIELQKLRSKMKKNIDTKSTKGRKIRYVVLPKLVNFMAPDPYNTWSDQAEADLYNSLFGKIKT